MTRPLYWERTFNTSFNWQLGTAGNQFLHSVSAGETLTRLILSLRFWAAAVDQTNPTEHSLYVPYTFVIFWADSRVITNPSLVSVQTIVQDYPDYVLHFERYSMRDAYTPAKFAAVNLGWIDDRPSMTVDIKAQRHNDRTDSGDIDARIAWQANATLLADPLAYTPLCSSSALIRGLAALP